MKDFIETVKAGFQDLPQFLTPIIILCLFVTVFGSADAALTVFLVLIGVWAVIFIIFPFIGLIIHAIGLVMNPVGVFCGKYKKRFDKWNKNTPKKDFEEI